MGSQQLLLVVLAMVLVGISLTVAITMFQANAIELSRDALTDDLMYFAGRARDFYWRPATLGGGGKSFASLTSLDRLTKMTTNENGRYFITSASKDELVIMGVGKITVGADTTTVRIIVNEQNNTIQVVH